MRTQFVTCLFLTLLSLPVLAQGATVSFDVSDYEGRVVGVVEYLRWADAKGEF